LAQMQTLSARMPSEDVAWLASLDVPGATTPSDKLRALVTEFREVLTTGGDFAGQLGWLKTRVSPALAAVAAFEHAENKHSEPIRLIAEWALQVTATLMAARSLQSSSAIQILDLERKLEDKSLEHAAALVRLTITPAAPCFDARSLDEKVIPLLQLCRIVDSTRKLTSEKSDG
jgi:hypothetical protein